MQVKGTKARSECYGISVGSSENDKGELVDTMFGGRYLDELEKRNGEWRISKRTYVADWIHQFPNGLEAVTSGDLILNILQIREPAHPLYREF